MMTVTDQQILSQVQEHLIEDVDNGATISSGLWTVSEVIQYLNDRQYDFLKRSLLLISRATISHLPMVTRHTLPSDWIATQRLVWLSSSGAYTEIPRSDGWEADHGIPDWPSASDADFPKLYTDGEVPTLQIQTMPAVFASGELQILYVALSSTLSNSGVSFTIPDEFVPIVKWGVMADMLGKVGRAHDPERAAYCLGRYEQGIELAKVILGGWS